MSVVHGASSDSKAHALKKSTVDQLGVGSVHFKLLSFDGLGYILETFLK